MIFKTPELADKWKREASGFKLEFKDMLIGIDDWLTRQRLPDLLVTGINDRYGNHVDCRLIEPNTGKPRYTVSQLCQVMHYKERYWKRDNGFVIYPHAWPNEGIVAHIHFSFKG